MKFFWRILNHIFGKYIANILVVLISFIVLWLGLSYCFQLNRAMSNQEIIALMNIPDSISFDILEDKCYSMIDANGCNLTLGYSTKERNAINKLLSKIFEQSTDSIRIWEDEKEKGKSFYKKKPYSVLITIRWNKKQGILRYSEITAKY